MYPDLTRRQSNRIGPSIGIASVKTLSAALTHPRFPFAVGALAILAVLPSLWGGWATDDHFHRLALANGERAKHIAIHNSNSPTGLYTFFDGVPEHTKKLMDVGVAPWWTCPEVHSSFLRPVGWFTHWLDYRLWPDSPAAMHAQSLVWYAALVGVVAVFYRRVMGATVAAGLAALLYAVDETHVIPVGWIANRNALLATFFGFLALISHDRWVRGGRHGGLICGPLLLALSLLSSEGGAGTLAYLAAYALFLDRAGWRRRFVMLLPYAAVVLVWRIAWKSMGYGAGGGGLAYLDPLSEPLRFAAASLERAPVLILAQFAWPPADVGTFIGWRVIFLIGLGTLFALLLIAVVVVPLVRQDVAAKFWATSTALALVPACASLPSDRNLLFVGVGAMGLVAQYLGAYYGWNGSPHEMSDRSERETPSRLSVPASLTPLCGPLAVLFVLVHGVLSPIALCIRAASPCGWKGLTEQLHVNLPAEPPLDQRDVVLVNGPSAFHGGYLPIRRANDGNTIPRHTRVISPSQAAVAIHRPDARTLVIRPEDGYLHLLYDRLYRSRDCPMSLGERIKLTGLTVEVMALTDDDRPAEASFHFHVPLEDPSLLWLKWEGGSFVQFTPPGVGETVILPAPIPSLF